MKNEDNISLADQLSRKAFSLVYRLILLAVGTLILISQENALFTYIYVIGFILYLLIFRYIIISDNWQTSLLRLLGDFALIYLVLFKKDIEIILNYFYLLLPIINAPNHSGKKSHLLYPLSLSTIYILSDKSLNETLYLPILVMIGVNKFRDFRNSLLEQRQSLIQILIRFFSENHDFRGFHKVYELLIERINNDKNATLLIKLQVNLIACFVLKNDKLLLINSSKFIRSYEVIKESGLIKKLRETGYETNSPIKLVGENFTDTLFIRTSLEDSEFVFLFRLPVNSFGIINSKLLLFFFRPICGYLHMVLHYHMEQRRNIDSTIERVRKQQNYVLKSMNVMHFVRNKLSPIKTYLNLGQIEVKLKEENKEEFKVIAQRSLIKAQKQLSNITERADFILEKSDNPFIISSVQRRLLNHLFSQIRFNWSSFFDTQNFDIVNTEEFSSITISYNVEVMDIVLVDLLRNMQKYGSNPKLTFIEEPKEIIIFLNNKFNSNSSRILNKAKQISSSYNSEDNWEINKRTSHGLILVKSYLKQMNIQSEIIVKNSYFIFKMKIPKI